MPIKRCPIRSGEATRPGAAGAEDAGVEAEAEAEAAVEGVP